MSDIRVQYCQDGMDISTAMYADEDADEIRVWCGDVVLVAVAPEPDGRWSVSSSDVAPVAGLLFADREEALLYVRATVEAGEPPDVPAGQETWV